MWNLVDGQNKLKQLQCYVWKLEDLQWNHRNATIRNHLSIKTHRTEKNHRAHSETLNAPNQTDLDVTHTDEKPPLPQAGTSYLSMGPVRNLMTDEENIGKERPTTKGC